MMTTRIPLLEKFGVCTVVMSYYGLTHRSFLLLSKLSSKSREMLDINYEGFLNSMMGNLFWIELDSSHIDKLMIELPWDLFKYNIILSLESVLEVFLKIIENISSKTGHYFNEHFMHSRLWIDHITVGTNLAKKLYLSLDLLKKTEVIECTLNKK